MAFRVKDLIINIVPSEGGDPGGVHPGGRCPCGCDYAYDYCPLRTHCQGESLAGLGPALPPYGIGCCHPSASVIPTLYYGIQLGPCTCCSRTISVPPPTHCKHHTRKPCDAAEATEELALLKAQLKQALKEIEEQEKALNESLQPQSVAEVVQLQKELNGALVELAKRKAELEKKK